jgi:integrase
MASYRKRGNVWYCRFRDETGRQKEVKCGTDKQAARRLGSELESRVARVKAGTEDPEQARFDLEGRRPLAEHVADHVRHQEGSGHHPRHVQQVRQKLEWFASVMGATRLSHITPSGTTDALATLRKRGMSDRTLHIYAATFKAFTNWARKDRRIARDPLADLPLPSIVTTKMRPPLEADDAAALIDHVRKSAPRCGLEGEDRAVLYLLAATTGLRRGELASLVPESFSLMSVVPAVTVQASHTKNKRIAVQPIARDLLPMLQRWLDTKALSVPVFRDLAHIHTGDMLQRDLKAAGVDAPDVVFHSLRHSFITTLARSSASPKEVQDLARHADPRLTFGVYSHMRVHDLAAAVNALPSLLRGREAATLTGTDKQPLAHALPTRPVFRRLIVSRVEPLTMRQTKTHDDTSRHEIQSPMLIPRGTETIPFTRHKPLSAKECRTPGHPGQKTHQQPLAHVLPTPQAGGDPDLAAIIEAWPDLPTAIKAAVVAIVKAARSR